MAASQKQGHHKPYGPKMSNPRIKRSHEHRHTGAIAIYQRLCKAAQALAIRDPRNPKGKVYWVSRAYYLDNQI